MYIRRLLWLPATILALSLLILGLSESHSYPPLHDPQPSASSLASVNISLAERRARLARYCLSKQPHAPPTPMNFRFVENVSPRGLPGDVAFCLPKKCGSTTLDQFVLNNIDSGDQEVWMWAGPRYSTREQVLARKSTLVVMVTRHPIERLVSAFRHLFRTGLTDVNLFLCAEELNKATGSCDLTPNAALAERIIQQLRPSSPDPLLSFQEFIRYLLDLDQEFTSLHSEVARRWGGLATHWQPYSAYCSTCRWLG